MDRYFTSVSVAKWALDEQSISIIRTMRHNRNGISKDLKRPDLKRKRRKISCVSLFRRWFNNACILCQQEKEWKKNIELLAMIPDVRGTQHCFVVAGKKQRLHQPGYYQNIYHYMCRILYSMLLIPSKRFYI